MIIDDRSAGTPTSITSGGGRFRAHRFRGPFNAAFFSALGPVIDAGQRDHKQRLFVDLPSTVVELGPGVGANLRYLRRGSTLLAIEPNPAMHRRLQRAAGRHGVRLDLHATVAERTELADRSVDAVISSLVLCTVPDPADVLVEVHRILRPGGTFRFVEHVAAPEGTATRVLQRIWRRPWAWVFEGCSCERELGTMIRQAGFAEVEIDSFRLRTPLPVFNPQIAGIARTS